MRRHSLSIKMKCFFFIIKSHICFKRFQYISQITGGIKTCDWMMWDNKRIIVEKNEKKLCN